jgi:hypothetical protein
MLSTRSRSHNSAMSINYGFRVPPRADYTAEVVLLVTSLGVRRHEFNTSKEVTDLLEIVRAHYKVIDFNMDTGGDLMNTSGPAKPELEVVRRLYQTHRVRQDTADGLICLPQVIIDGVNIGDHTSLQALEDDELLHGILMRTVCAQCHAPRTGEYCYKCKTLFQEMMPKHQLKDELINRLKHQRIPFMNDSGESFSSSDDDHE